MKKIVGVTVTYNSSHYLERCIKALQNQTYGLYKIIIVDNNSNEEHIQKNLKLVNDQIDYITLSENTGGAGGFEKGFERAMCYNPDWIWIMDDDAFPKNDCLEKLLSSNLVEKENVGCLCPAIYGVDFDAFQVYHHKRISNFLFKDKPMYYSYNDFPTEFEINANAFVGPLISKKAINEVGIPNGGLFIYGDDTEYTYRINRKFKIYVIKDAIINHRDVTFVDNKKNVNPKIWWKDYYMYRNMFLFIKEFSHNKIHQLIASLYLTIFIDLRVFSAFIKPKFRGYRKLRKLILLKAIKDGKTNRNGKIIDPAKYNSLLETQIKDLYIYLKQSR